jgi:chondroitin AC lyase
VQRAIVLILAFIAPGLFASVDTVRQNFADYYSAAGADRSAPLMADALATLEAQTRDATAPGFLNADGTWSDINYKEVPSGAWSPWDHFRRLTTMAKAYRTPGQRYYNDEVLRQQIEAALAYVPTFYGHYTLPQGNWWFWTLGAPLDLGPTLVLMRGSVSPKVYADCVDTLLVHIGTSPTAKGLVGPTPVGENLVWSCFTHLCLALARDDAATLSAVRDALGTACSTTAGDGIQIDSSFHQHGPQLYTGGYGGSFAYDVSRLALLLRNSEFALSTSALTSFANYVADGIAWSLYGPYFDVSVVGREVARSSTSGINGIAALLQSSTFASPRNAEIRGAAAAALKTWRWPLAPELAALAAQTTSSASSPAGHQHYYTSDYTVHRRPAWFASVKMFSTRTKSGENTNGENILGSRQSDGRFYLVLSGDEYFGNDTWPALDWSRLPGITVEQKADAANDQYGFGTRSFAGGTGDGQNGVSAMELAPINSVLAAKKSWFFFDDSIVFLTAGITSPSFNKVETIINQWPLKSGLTRNGNWLAADDIGYYVYPQSAKLNVTTAPRTGTWAALGGSTDTTPRTQTFLTLWLDHGANPTNADAAYAIVPGATAQTMASWLPPSILANTPSASAVANGNSAGVVIWTANATAGGFSADAPAVIYATASASSMQVSIADPTSGNGTFHVTVPGRWIATNVPYATDSRATTLTLPRAGGATARVTLTPAPTKRRAAGTR